MTLCGRAMQGFCAVPRFQVQPSAIGGLSAVAAAVRGRWRELVNKQTCDLVTVEETLSTKKSPNVVTSAAFPILTK